MITRLLVPIATLIVLAGCAHGAEIWSAPPDDGPAMSDHKSLQGDAHCQAVARQRANDARANGYSIEIADSVFSEAYQDCMVELSKRAS